VGVIFLQPGGERLFQPAGSSRLVIIIGGPVGKSGDQQQVAGFAGVPGSGWNSDDGFGGAAIGASGGSPARRRAIIP